MAQYTAQYDIVQGGAAQHGIAQHGKARYGTLREFNPQEREANGHDGTTQPRGAQEQNMHQHMCSARECCYSLPRWRLFVH